LVQKKAQTVPEAVIESRRSMGAWPTSAQWRFVDAFPLTSGPIAVTGTSFGHHVTFVRRRES
jgi:hypothetical protein